VNRASTARALNSVSCTHCELILCVDVVGTMAAATDDASSSCAAVRSAVPQDAQVVTDTSLRN
jgi:hypothetical protein